MDPMGNQRVVTINPALPMGATNPSAPDDPALPRCQDHHCWDGLPSSVTKVPTVYGGYNMISL